MTDITPQLVKELRERTGVGVTACKEALQKTQGDIEKAISELRKSGMASAVKKASREANEGVICIEEGPKCFALVEVNAETDFVTKSAAFQEFAKNITKEACHIQPVNLEDFLNKPYSKEKDLTIDQYRALLVGSLGENIRIRRTEIFEKKPDCSLAIYSHLGGKLVTVVEITGSSEHRELAKDIAMHIAAESPEYLSEKEIPQRIVDHEKEIAKAQIKNKPDHVIEKIVDGKLKAYFNQVCLLHQLFIKDTSMTIQALLDKCGKESGKKLTVTQFLRWKVGGG